MKTYKNQIENAAQNVFRSLGRGQAKSAYQTAIMCSLQEQGLSIIDDKTCSIYYEKMKLINYEPDLFINEHVIVQVMNKDILKIEEELKFTNQLTKLHLEIGYIINFGLRIQVRTKYRRDKVIPIH